MATRQALIASHERIVVRLVSRPRFYIWPSTCSNQSNLSACMLTNIEKWWIKATWEERIASPAGETIQRDNS